MDNNNAMKAKELRDLQNSIKEINTERAKREGQRDNLVKQLKEELAFYLERNDISIKINGLDEAYAFAKKEYAKVREQQKQEIELKQRLVALYEQKNIQGMRELLELEDSEDDFVVSHKGTKTTSNKEEVKPKKDEVKPKAKPVKEDIKKEEPSAEDAFADLMFDDDDDDEMIFADENASTTDRDEEEDNIADDFDLDIDWE